MTWWEIKPLLAAGAKGRLPAWGLDQRIRITAGAGRVPALAVIDTLAAGGSVVSSRVVRAADFGESEFRATNWEVITDG